MHKHKSSLMLRPGERGIDRVDQLLNCMLSANCTGVISWYLLAVLEAALCFEVLICRNEGCAKAGIGKDFE